MKNTLLKEKQTEQNQTHNAMKNVFSHDKNNGNLPLGLGPLSYALGKHKTLFLIPYSTLYYLALLIYCYCPL